MADRKPVHWPAESNLQPKRSWFLHMAVQRWLGQWRNAEELCGQPIDSRIDREAQLHTILELLIVLTSLRLCAVLDVEFRSSHQRFFGRLVLPVTRSRDRIFT